MKKLHIAFVFILSLFIFTFSSCASSKMANPSPKPDNVNYVRYSEEKCDIFIRLYYPVIGKYEKLNDKINEVIKDNYLTFEESMKDKVDERKSFILDSVVRSQKDIISVKLIIQTSLNEKDKNVIIKTVCYNKKEDALLSILDVSPLTVEELSKKAKDELSILYPSMKEKIDEITTGNEENYSVFTIEGDSLCIYFNDLIKSSSSSLVPSLKVSF